FRGRAAVRDLRSAAWWCDDAVSRQALHAPERLHARSVQGARESDDTVRTHGGAEREKATRRDPLPESRLVLHRSQRARLRRGAVRSARPRGLALATDDGRGADAHALLALHRRPRRLSELAAGRIPPRRPRPLFGEARWPELSTFSTRS